MTSSIKLAIALLSAPALAVSAPAFACQGVQFESSLVFLSEEPATDVPEGMQQFRVSVSELSLRNLYDRELMRVYLLDTETGERLRGDDQPNALSIVLPVGTSCDHVSVPGPGEYYLVGNLVNNDTGGLVMINGAALAYPRYHSTPRGLLLEAPTQ